MAEADDILGGAGPEGEALADAVDKMNREIGKYHKTYFSLDYEKTDHKKAMEVLAGILQ